MLTRYSKYNKINVKYYIEIITRRFCQQSGLVIFIYGKVTPQFLILVVCLVTVFEVLIQ